jgi:menaquinone-9 beta-reductase
MRYDAIVIGAGPGGTSAAITLGMAGRRVLLLEKSRFPREKLCGEFLTPECRAIFNRLGVLDRLISAGAALISQYNIYSQEGNGIEIPLRWLADGEGEALGLSRGRMDTILLDRAREVGVEVREEFSVAAGFRVEDGDGIVEGQHASVKESFRAGLVIDASGRNGAFSRQLSRQAGQVSLFQGARIFGCKVHLRRIPGMAGLGELYFFADGYGGLSDIEGERSNLCFLTTEKTLLEARGDREKLLDLTLNTNPVAKKRLKEAVMAGEWHGTGPITYGRQQKLAGVLAVGDSSAFIDPFTGSGMLLALTSGELAGQVVDQHLSAGNRKADEIIADYEVRHRSMFTRRYRAVSMLRNLAFRPAARKLMVTILARQQSLARAVARSTRSTRMKQ